MKIPVAIKREIEKVLSDFSTVRWDRFTVPPDQECFTIYGWIDRPKDSYKDFILLRYWPPVKTTDDKILEGEWGYTTSSPEIHSEINRIFHGGKVSPTSNPCIRIEEHFDIPNSIKL